jgi:hypothetical protein
MDEQDDEEMDEQGQDEQEQDAGGGATGTPWSIIRVNALVTLEGTTTRLGVFNSMIVV